MAALRAPQCQRSPPPPQRRLPSRHPLLLPLRQLLQLSPSLLLHPRRPLPLPFTRLLYTRLLYTRLLYTRLLYTRVPLNLHL